MATRRCGYDPAPLLGSSLPWRTFIKTHMTPLAGMDRPTEEWMLQMARNLTDVEDGFLLGKRYLLHDRDPLFTCAFRCT